jgi:pyridoxal phosphate enzyme (YggS family)
MPVNQQAYTQLHQTFTDQGVTLIAVSKTKPASDIQALYDLGHREFGENYVQELIEKAPLLPADIHWHFIGHLQRNKVKFILPFVYLIHSVDSLRLLLEIEKQAARLGRKVHVLLQIYIAGEETKFGLDEPELDALFHHIEKQPLQHVHILGLMGMASFSDDQSKVENEFLTLRKIFDQYKKRPASHVDFQILSMGMSGDYPFAIRQGSNMVRIGSLLFGTRN